MRDKIIVLGASGYIGSILMRELPKFHDDVVGITRKVLHDLTDYEAFHKYIKSLEGEKITVVNCAASGAKQFLGSYDKDQLWNNLKINDNILRCQYNWHTYINIGSGSEFDISSRGICDVKEGEFYDCLPKDSYGLSKNLIARSIGDNRLGLNLRLFGCFDHTEPSFRFLKTCVTKCLSGEPIVIPKDRLFSWISGIDLAQVISQLITDTNMFSHIYDLNCAYNNKMLLSEMAYHVSRIFGSGINIKIENKFDKEYSCDSYLLTSECKLPYGLEESIEHYVNEFKNYLKF
ncbi:MAG: NAD-dependent epimerase/dehydratase family protein [Candidatus Levybacteria bacterium]|nr:NAD-dependent epimerase/dehydratase family protein [Candidatus Levybacteria bacterium]